MEKVKFYMGDDVLNISHNTPKPNKLNINTKKFNLKNNVDSKIKSGSGPKHTYIKFIS